MTFRVLALILVCGGRLSGQAATTVDRDHLPLRIMPDTLAVCRLNADGPLPPWALVPQPFLTITRTRTELSVTAPQSLVADEPHCERDYRAVRVVGPLPLDLIGIVAALAEPLAREGVSLFAISTYETDYVLVKAADLPRAMQAWRRAGHTIAAAP
jgi:hypothetical protein